MCPFHTETGILDNLLICCLPRTFLIKVVPEHNVVAAPTVMSKWLTLLQDGSHPFQIIILPS
jgi:hypothetical protein